MPLMKRYKTKYPGVYYIVGVSIGSGKSERIYYVRYRKHGKSLDEPVGRQFQDNMTAAKANTIRAQKIEGDRLSNAEKRKKEIEIKIQSKNRWTVSKLWDEYKSRNPQIKGLEIDKNRFKNYLESTFGNNTPSEITQTEIDIFRIKLLKKKSPATVKNIFELLRRIVNFGKKKQLTKGIDFVIEMPNVDNRKTEDLTPEQLKKLLKILRTDKNRDICNIMQLALFTGMRKSEILRLQWNHIDFEKRFINIIDPKGSKNQVIPLNDMVRKVLMSQRRTRNKYVFPARNGKVRVDIKRPLDRIKKVAELPADFRPLHGLRHTFASYLASSGQVDLYTLQALLTHKSPQMTQRYAHLRDDTLKKASNHINKIFK